MLKLTVNGAKEEWSIVFVSYVLLFFSAFFYQYMPQYLPLYVSENIVMRELYMFMLIFSQIFIVFIITKRNTNYLFISFIILYVIKWISAFAAETVFSSSVEIGSLLFSLLLGAAIGNIFNMSAVLKSAVCSRAYIKIGIILFGATNLTEYMGSLSVNKYGFLYVVLVFIFVCIFCFRLQFLLKYEKRVSEIMASAISTCSLLGTISIGNIIKDNSSRIFTMILTLLVLAVGSHYFTTYALSFMGVDDNVAGAWVGSSILSINSSFDVANKYGTLVSHDVINAVSLMRYLLVYVLIIASSLFVAYRKKVESDNKISLWQSFPKFVIGFIVAVFLFQFIEPDAVAKVNSVTQDFTYTIFNLALICIGFDVDIKSILSKAYFNIAFACFITQFFMLSVSLAIACFVFGWLL